ncbi:hypothetical protein [Clostridium beijerinckii]|uniref:hypothetical protein n=1 Tax=Clostridium beijerinckii TaxID=1520 RepID=UPI00098C3AEC|nr:hypothetical protein [Clostridium beijerinckii]NRT76333.1 hypothetical protein [Clostridium beijerinckii]OOM48630.1 hypothetical protein CBEIJ_21020 [Clostridium beijerinckii]
MKKFALIFSIFLLISLNFNTISAVAQTETFSEGIYTINDLKLLANVPYKVRNVSGGKAFISILNDDLVLEQSIRFEENSLQYVLNPMQYDYKIVILGTGQLSFSGI